MVDGNTKRDKTVNYDGIRIKLSRQKKILRRNIFNYSPYTVEFPSVNFILLICFASKHTTVLKVH